MVSRNCRTTVCVFVQFVTQVVIPTQQARIRQKQDNGFKAAAIGVPAEANPYRDSRDRKAWLDGWINQKQNSRIDEDR